MPSMMMTMMMTWTTQLQSHPFLSTEETDNSLNMGDEHLDTIPEIELEEVIMSSVEDLVPIPSALEGIPDTINDDSLYNENIEYVEASPHNSEVVSLEVAEFVIPEDEEIEDDNLREKLLNVYLLIANIEALKDNPTPSFEFLTNSSSTSPKSFLEETNTFHNSLPEFENFCFDLEEISSGSTTAHSYISLSDYKAFYFNDDHIEEISGGSELISILNSRIYENLSSTTHVNLPVEDDHSPLLVPMNSGSSRACDSVNKNKALRGRHPMLINIVQYSQKYEDSCRRILSSKSSFPQLQLGIILLHLAGSQSMLKFSYKAEDGVIISIPPIVGGVADVVVEIKGTDVGAKADFTNLETTITIIPIPTTRVHKDHHVTQIIGDLSSATQTRSMTRVAKDQCGLSRINNDDFHTCMFDCFLSQEESKREEVYVCQPPGFEDPDYPDKTCVKLEKLMKDKFQMSSIDRKSASTPIDTEKPLLKDSDGEDMDVHTYKSLIGSLMYLTSSRPDIMFAVCACARFHVTPKVSHLHAVKSLFRYLKGKPHLGLWYPKDSPFILVACLDSDYAGASLDKKSTIEGFNSWMQINLLEMQEANNYCNFIH
nr:uncharacterized mitochondrial protein AtMg00810-like [Tanacetum cinerariifolium]